MSENRESWSDWSKYVLKELERINTVIDNLTKELNDVKVEVGKLQVKASIWGGLSGLITTLIAIAFYIMKG